MRLKVLVDNNTYIDHNYFMGEPALSFYIENKNDRILFDTGYTDILMRNAEKMNIDLSKINKIVFSHGHNDHTNGFEFLSKKYDMSKAELYCLEGCFRPKYESGDYIGAPFSQTEVEKKCVLNISNEPVEISSNLILLGRIPDYFDFEKRKSIGTLDSHNGPEDLCYEDTAMAYKMPDGIFIITGCSHSGICNIIEHAIKVTGQERIKGVIGGFHIFENDIRLSKTIEYFEQRNINNIYPCHCVSFRAKAEIDRHIPIFDVASGFELNI